MTTMITDNYDMLLKAFDNGDDEAMLALMDWLEEHGSILRYGLYRKFTVRQIEELAEVRICRVGSSHVWWIYANNPTATSETWKAMHLPNRQGLNFGSKFDAFISIISAMIDLGLLQEKP
jgi:hypothetical protein